MLTTLQTTRTKLRAILGSALTAALLMGLASASPARAGGARCQARYALDAEGADKTAAIESLRSLGPAAVSALWDEIRRDPDWAAQRESWAGTLDAVCGMKDCAEARLFWTTDLSEALRRAHDTGRPVLSLRLLGHLDRELSCANSRLFRLALYTNPRISEELREHWVLHWHTVREVPTVTIRFAADRAGGERTLEGTVTGNSIHYVLDAQGRIVDALPGLYGPGAFLDALVTARQRAIQAADEPDAQFHLAQTFYHLAGLQTARQLLNDGLRDLGVREDRPAEPLVAVDSRGETHRIPAPVRPVSARTAAARAQTKMAVETEVLDAVALDAGLTNARSAIDWPALGRLHPEWNGTDMGTEVAHRDLLRRRLPAGADLAPALDTLHRLFLADTAQNELLLRPVLRRWLSGEPQRDLDAFDQRVYAELFLTPLSDPWLGLSPQTLYTALRPVEPSSR